MNFVITPYKSAGSIELGMSRDHVRQILGSEFKVVTGIELVDVFHDIGVQVIYDYKQPHICKAVMLYQPANAIFHSRNLLGGESIEDLRIWLESMDNSIKVATEGITSYQFGIYLSTQDIELFGHEPPESIMVFQRGYYNES